MSSVSLETAPSVVVESIETGRTYSKVSVISYLIGKSVANCYRDKEPTKLKECDELNILIEHYGLLPLGHSQRWHFFGEDIIRAERFRAMGVTQENSHNRLSHEEKTEKAKAK